MKRDPRLQDLSRDHHHALVLARKARRAADEGSDEDVTRTWRAIREAFQSELEPHFEVEETHLLPALEKAGEEELPARTRTQHRRLRELPNTDGNARELLATFGELLRDHVRFEESELFPAAERRLGADQLGEIAEASAATEAAMERAAVRAARDARNEE